MSVIPLDHRTHLATKVKGDTSMFGKAGSREATKLLAGRGPDGMVKARLLEPQCPIWKNADRKRWLTAGASKMPGDASHRETRTGFAAPL